MNELNSRFLSELFINKQVRCHQDVYMKTFPLIWPCEEYFREFLSCSIIDLKYEYAKKIYRHMRAFEDVILPEFAINNVIALQQKKLAVSNKGYVAQDHVIHSINLYILGIYLFFNFPLFHKKILSEDLSEKTLYSRVIVFVKKWKIFSLYHDVGYFFESNIDNSGNIITEDFEVLKEYEGMYSHLLYEYVTRSVARTILTSVLIQRNRRTLSPKIVETFFEKSWKRGEKAILSNEEIRGVLNPFIDATMVDDVQSDVAFSHFVYVLEQKKVLVVIYDKDEYPIGFAERLGSEIKNVFVAKDSILDKSEIYDANSSEALIEKIPVGCSLRYCIIDATSAVYAHLPVEIAERAKKYLKQLPERLRLGVSLASTDSQINQCYFSIYCWLSEKAEQYLASDEALSEYRIFEKSMEKYYKEAINNCLSRHVDGVVSNMGEIKDKEIEGILSSIIKNIAESDKMEQLSEAICNEAVSRYKAEEGVPHDMMTYYTQTCRRVQQSFGCFKPEKYMGPNREMVKQLEPLQFMQMNVENKMEIKLFGHGTGDFETALYNHIAKLAENLHIDFKKLTTYTTKHSNSDHGLVSAGLLYQATVFSHYLAEYRKEHNDIKMAWHGLAGYTGLVSGECVKEYAEVIFAILLHNVYIPESAPGYGIDYRHGISDDAFSYFCAFCDTFQKWHRQKQVDFSKVELPPKNFLSDEFDLLVTDDKICLKCRTQDAVFIRAGLMEEDKFLPGIMQFVQIKEY